MNTKEQIEKQISEAKGFHDSVIRARNSLDLNSFALFMTEVTSRLLQIVQNQQAEIEELKENAWIARGVLEAYEDVRTRNDSLMDTVRKLKEVKR